MKKIYLMYLSCLLLFSCGSEHNLQSDNLKALHAVVTSDSSIVAPKELNLVHTALDSFPGTHKIRLLKYHK